MGSRCHIRIVATRRDIVFGCTFGEEQHLQHNDLTATTFTSELPCAAQSFFWEQFALRTVLCGRGPTTGPSTRLWLNTSNLPSRGEPGLGSSGKDTAC